MASPKQIKANRENAKLSTGPLTPETREISAKNSTVHGFTGQNVVVPPQEKAAYDAHVASYIDHHSPTGCKQIQLVHQLADLDWTLHQISLQQINTIALIDSIYRQCEGNNDPLATAQAVAGVSRTLSNLNLYEVRRRRAAKTVAEELDALQKAEAEQVAAELPQCAAIYKLHKAKGENWNPEDFGFVCSLQNVLEFIHGEEWAAELNNLRKE